MLYRRIKQQEYLLQMINAGRCTSIEQISLYFCISKRMLNV